MIKMVSRSISISDEAYNMLTNFQLKGESYSQTLIRLFKRQENLLELAGAWAKIPDSEDAIKIIEETVKKAKEEKFSPIRLI
jgi:predicted CopG family antitoxin